MVPGKRKLWDSKVLLLFSTKCYHDKSLIFQIPVLDLNAGHMIYRYQMLKVISITRDRISDSQLPLVWTITCHLKLTIKITQDAWVLQLTA